MIYIFLYNIIYTKKFFYNIYNKKGKKKKVKNYIKNLIKK